MTCPTWHACLPCRNNFKELEQAGLLKREVGRIPTSPTTLWGLRVRQDGERGQGGVTLGRSAGGRVVGAMERVLHGPPPLLMPLDHVCPLPKVCSRGLS